MELLPAPKETETGFSHQKSSRFQPNVRGLPLDVFVTLFLLEIASEVLQRWKNCAEK